ncbi:MAG: PAS domain-containing protein [Nitrospira sp.]
MQPSKSLSNRFGDSWIVRYGIAVLVVVLATLLRIALRPIIPIGFPFLTFFLAVMLAAWRGGLGPGLVASVLSTLAADLFLIEPVYEFHLAAGHYGVSLGVFVVEALSITMLTDRMKRTQRTLRENEARLRLAMQGAGLAAWEMNLQTGITRFDDRLLALLGIPEDSETTMTWTDLIHVDDRERVINQLTAASEGHGVFDTEFRVNHSDGSLRWLASWGHLIEVEESEHMGGLVQDITERKHAEESLRRSEERLKSILHRAPVAIFIKDPAGRYLFMNEECGLVLGLNHETALGQTDHDLLPSELAAQFMAHDRHVWESDQFLTVEEFVPQMDGVHTSLVQKFLLRDKQGSPYALSGIALDITPRLKLEAAIQASEARLQLAQSAANIGVFDWDLVAHKGLWSPELERIWGLPVGGFDGTGDAWRQRIHPDDQSLAHAGTQRSLNDPATASEFEYRILRPDGAIRWIYAKAKTLCDSRGRARRMVGVNLDITDRKEAQLRLERSAQELETQVEDRTRDLVQSQERLRALTSELNLAEQRERKRLATELHDYLQQLLVFGKLTIGQGKQAASGVPAFEAVLKKVDDVLSSALTYSRTLVAELSPRVLRDHGLSASLKWLAEYMKTKYEQTVTVVLRDDHELSMPEDQCVLVFQSVRELLINSAKYSGTGTASVTIEQRAGHLFVTVTDEGMGFDSSAEAGAPPGESVSKFGLFSIQERMRALGGLFEIHSAPGQGTTATLMLPLAVSVEGATISDPQVASHGSQMDAAPRDRSVIRLAIVDDHAMIRQGLRAMLQAYEEIQVCGEAANGEDAITLVQSIRPDVVLMDINMPKKNGIEATAAIKQCFPHIIIVGLSVIVDRANREAMIQAGAATLLTKEAPVEELYRAIVYALQTASP